MSNTSLIHKDIQPIPNQPGIYKFYNKDNQLIYVGKAKALKKRVSSYFNKISTSSIKTRRLVNEIVRIDYVVVNSEFDALLLENNLIKENQPKYNILLKDDKSFPFICISNERFPKIYSTRRSELNEGQYFGPYTSVKAMNNVLELIRKLYKIRTCTYNLSEKNIAQKKFKICLEYHIGNCLGPCEDLQTEDDYLEEINQAKNILKGNLQIVRKHFEHKMRTASQELQFEQAQTFKDKLDLLEKFQARTIIVNPKLKNTDVFTIISEDKNAIVNYMRIDNGMINISDSISINKKLDESDQEILRLVITNTRNKFGIKNDLILTNIKLPSWSDEIEVITPKQGDKRKLLDLSLKNALIFKKDLLNKGISEKQRSNRVLEQIQKDLRLKALPVHIECFDNSNFQGSNPVASMVCFKNGKPSKTNYRHYKIKTVEGPDDFKSMKEIVNRRYTRLIAEKSKLPQLIIVDGGKGQLNAACEALKQLGIYNKLAIVGIAKKLEEIYYPDDPLPLHLSKKSESLRIIQQLRDEAHRFAITFHRQLRSNTSIVSELDQIKGIGEKTKMTLFREFRSIKRIREASEEDLISLIGKSKTKILRKYLH